MSEWFKEPVLKTGDSQEPWVRIPLSPPLPHFTAADSDTQKYPSGRRGSPAKGVDGLNRARVQIPPSAPDRSKHFIAYSDFFVHSAVFAQKEDIQRMSSFSVFRGSFRRQTLSRKSCTKWSAAPSGTVCLLRTPSCTYSASCSKGLFDMT